MDLVLCCVGQRGLSTCLRTSHNKPFAAERKKPRPLKSSVPGDSVAGNRGADFVSRD